MFRLFLLSFTSLNFVSFASQVAILIGTDGIIPLMISAGVMYLFSASIINLMDKHKGKTLYDIMRIYLGKVFSAVIYSIYIISILYLYSYCVRIICSQVKVYMLKDMPLWVIEMLFIFSTAYAARKGFDAIINFSSVAAFPVIFILAVLFFLCLKNMDIFNMLPMFTHRINEYADSSLHLISYNFSSAFSLPFILSHMREYDAKGVKKDIGKSIIISAMIFISYYVLIISVLGVSTTSKIVFPAINIMHNRTSSGIFLNRYEIIMVFNVIIMYFLYAAVMLLSAYEGIRDVTGNISSTVFSSFMIIIFLTFLNDRTGGEYIAGLLHMKGYFAAVPVIFTAVFFIMKKVKKNE